MYGPRRKTTTAAAILAIRKFIVAYTDIFIRATRKLGEPNEMLYVHPCACVRMCI